MSHFLHKPDNWSSVPRMHLKATAIEQASVSTKHLCLVWETETGKLLEAHSLPSLAYAEVDSKRDLVISKVEGEDQHPRLSSDLCDVCAHTHKPCREERGEGKGRREWYMEASIKVLRKLDLKARQDVVFSARTTLPQALARCRVALWKNSQFVFPS